MPLGAITANQAGGFHLDSYKGAFANAAHIQSVLVENASEAQLTLISDSTRPKVEAGERKNFACPPGCREVFLECNATVNASEVRVTIRVCREGF